MPDMGKKFSNRKYFLCAHRALSVCDMTQCHVSIYLWEGVLTKGSSASYSLPPLLLRTTGRLCFVHADAR